MLRFLDRPSGQKWFNLKRLCLAQVYSYYLNVIEHNSNSIALLANQARHDCTSATGANQMGMLLYNMRYTINTCRVMCMLGGADCAGHDVAARPLRRHDRFAGRAVDCGRITHQPTALVDRSPRSCNTDHRFRSVCSLLNKLWVKWGANCTQF